MCEPRCRRAHSNTLWLPRKSFELLYSLAQAYVGRGLKRLTWAETISPDSIRRIDAPLEQSGHHRCCE
jgi:hypothetical protein